MGAVKTTTFRFRVTRPTLTTRHCLGLKGQSNRLPFLKLGLPMPYKRFAAICGRPHDWAAGRRTIFVIGAAVAVLRNAAATEGNYRERMNGKTMRDVCKTTKTESVIIAINSMPWPFVFSTHANSPVSFTQLDRQICFSFFGQLVAIAPPSGFPCSASRPTNCPCRFFGSWCRLDLCVCFCRIKLAVDLFNQW